MDGQLGGQVELPRLPRRVGASVHEQTQRHRRSHGMRQECVPYSTRGLARSGVTSCGTMASHKLTPPSPCCCPCMPRVSSAWRRRLLGYDREETQLLRHHKSCCSLIMVSISQLHVLGDDDEIPESIELQELSMEHSSTCCTPAFSSGPRDEVKPCRHSRGRPPLWPARR